MKCLLIFYYNLHLFYTFRGTGGKLLCSVRILPEISGQVSALDLYLSKMSDAVIILENAITRQY